MHCCFDVEKFYKISTDKTAKLFNPNKSLTKVYFLLNLSLLSFWIGIQTSSFCWIEIKQLCRFIIYSWGTFDKINASILQILNNNQFNKKSIYND